MSGIYPTQKSSPQSKFLQVKGVRMHYLEAGEGHPMLFLHGNPTHSYIWRNIIPHLSTQVRCIAPDLIGMGKSDKPDIAYEFTDHVAYLDEFIDRLGLQNITLVLHDWGSALGFYFAMRHPQQIKAIVFMEAILTDVEEVFDEQTKAFFSRLRDPEEGWKLIVNENIFLEKILPSWVARKLTAEELAAYQEPFLHNPQSRKVLYKWPALLPFSGQPVHMAEILVAYKAWLISSLLPKLIFTAWPGAFMPTNVVQWCIDNLPNLQVVDLGEGIHFVQEDHPHAIGRAISKWYKSLSNE
jgi:haloalkane dehalogenase